jgi:peptidoglycan/xylan/chitin deacetylase (PgdA/CDA1 family)
MRRFATVLTLTFVLAALASCCPAPGMQREQSRVRTSTPPSAAEQAVVLLETQTPVPAQAPERNQKPAFDAPWWQQRNRELEESMERYRPHASKEQITKDISRMTIDPDKPMVALSFDDGPTAGVTDQILNILQKYNARATFFVCGWRFAEEKNREMIRRMAALGCEIGNHTWSHANISEENYVAVRYEIESTNDAVFEATGLRPRCFRPPGGVNGYDATRVTREDNMYIVLWSQSGNVNEFDPKRIAQNVDKQIVDGKELHAGDVILLHDTHECMVDAVKIIVPRLIAEGYQLVTVWELLNCSGIPLVPGELYQN